MLRDDGQTGDCCGVIHAAGVRQIFVAHVSQRVDGVTGPITRSAIDDVRAGRIELGNLVKECSALPIDVHRTVEVAGGELFRRADINDSGDGTHVYILGRTPGYAQRVAVEKGSRHVRKVNES